MIKAIVGANWGDEGKGKITDVFAQEADYIVRFQGGSNAGHTIKNEYGKFALHLLPSGIFNENSFNVLGNGVALNVDDLFNELENLRNANIKMGKLLISDRAQIVMPYHTLFDAYEEERLAGKSFGSTKSGIAPCYSDKYAKIGFQVNQLYLNDEELKYKIKNICAIKNVLLKELYNKPLLDEDDLYNTVKRYGQILKPYVVDTSLVLNNAIKDNKVILLEGQLGAMKDTDHGIYPMVTSSSTLAGYGAIGAGIPPYEIKEVISVVKAYSSAVGAGAFVSEIFGKAAEKLRANGGDGGEYGATTGRPRRVGWFDVVATKYGCKLQGATRIALTVVDALSYLKEIPICIGYEINGIITKDFPNTTKLAKAKPVLETMPGWLEDIRGINDFNRLPQNCKNYINRIESEIGYPIDIVSNGPSRSDLIYK
ncbi:MAG TPA: adenylosuccinate synthase [Anaerovoracaceae bacterium]|nr:adenylosuccinate synthase [Anaerovoracaceae bacterium]